MDAFANAIYSNIGMYKLEPIIFEIVSWSMYGSYVPTVAGKKETSMLQL